MREKPKITEEMLGKAMMKHLADQGWDCYPEVSRFQGSARPDLSAVRFGYLMIVETKTQLSFEVIDQALHWLGTAHFVAIGVPKAKQYRARWGFVQEFLRQKGIGLFEIAVEPDRYGESGLWSHVRETLPAKPHRYAHGEAKKFMEFLNPDTRLVNPGIQGGGYMTEFKRTLRKLEDYVRRFPGCTLKAAIENTEHHYASNASARGALANLIHLADLDVVRHQSGKLKALYPKGGAPAQAEPFRPLTLVELPPVDGVIGRSA